MKITKLSQLDELVAKHLGYIYYQQECDFYGEHITNYCWIPPEIKPEDYSKYLYSFNKDNWFLEYQMDCPAFSTNLIINQKVVNHIHSLDLDLNIQSNKYFCIARIEEVDRDEPEVLAWWDSVCGNNIEALNYCDIDSSINSIPLAICLAFLKYKGIEMELEIDDTI